jgi:2,4-dienoyl-CoA reductase-like NADH-dependent reductase (Old Yellow Enzyme family)
LTIRVGPITVPNRIVRTAHWTHFSHPPAPYIEDDTIAYHRERAIGGVGLTILGGVGVHRAAG